MFSFYFFPKNEAEKGANTGACLFWALALFVGSFAVALLALVERDSDGSIAPKPRAERVSEHLDEPMSDAEFDRLRQNLSRDLDPESIRNAYRFLKESVRRDEAAETEGAED